MIRVGNVKIWMKNVHTFGAGRLKRQAETTLLFQYITSIIEITNLNVEGCKSYLPVLSIICHYFTVNATGMAICLFAGILPTLVWTLNAGLLSSAEFSFEIIVFQKYVFQEYK